MEASLGTVVASSVGLSVVDPEAPTVSGSSGLRSELESFGDWAFSAPGVGAGGLGAGSVRGVEVGMLTFGVALCGV